MRTQLPWLDARATLTLRDRYEYAGEQAFAAVDVRCHHEPPRSRWLKALWRG